MGSNRKGEGSGGNELRGQLQDVGWSSIMSSKASITALKYGLGKYNPLHTSLTGSKQKSRVRFRDAHKRSAKGHEGEPTE